jgi:hypothetical protein
MPIYASILRIPHIWVWRATVEWYIDRGKPKNSWEKLVSVPLCPPQIPHGLTRARTRASAATNDLSHGTALITLRHASVSKG